MKIPVRIMLIRPFGIIGDEIKNFMKLACCYAAALTLFSYFLDVLYPCFVAKDKAASLNCSFTGAGFFIYQIIKIVLIASFIKNWVKIVFLKEKISLMLEKFDLRIIASILATTIVCLLPMVSLYFLTYREPNPNWRIEVVYFFFASIGMWAPIVLIRFFPAVGSICMEAKFPSLKNAWDSTKDNAFKIVLFLVVLLFISLFVIANITQSIVNAQVLTMINIVFIDFIYNVFTLLVLAIFINHCIMLAEFIKGENK